MLRRRVLIFDFDFFTTIGGGQTFYRRVVGRNPQTDFLFPSRGADLIEKRCGRLPANAHPFAIETDLTKPDLFPAPDLSSGWLRQHYSREVCAVAAAVQGEYFDVADIPSFFPVGGILRPIFSAYGVTVRKIALSLLGWQSVSCRHAYGATVSEATIASIEAEEIQSVDCADVRYTISDVALHQSWRISLPIVQLDMHDTFESFPQPAAEPPGEGRPDLWYVGRLDGAKGPDIFVDLAARVPRESYGRCLITGPDNDWDNGTRWSEHVLSLARSKGIDAEYVGRLSDEELRRRVFAGRNVVAVPSRTDTFNYVALEALLNGCPLLLSERTGAAVFLREHHADICPPIINPDDANDSALQLRDLLENYSVRAGELRRRLRETPFPSPRMGFMDAVYANPPARGAETDSLAGAETERLLKQGPLTTPLGRVWRPLHGTLAPRVSLVLPACESPEQLAPLLARIARQDFEAIEVIVVANGGSLAAELRAVAASFGLPVRLLCGNWETEAAAFRRGVTEARGEFVAALQAGDGLRPELITESVAILDVHPEAAGTFADWDLIDGAGRLLKAVRTPGPAVRSPWDPCQLGPGTLIRLDTLRRAERVETHEEWRVKPEAWPSVTDLGPFIHIPQTLACRTAHGMTPDASSLSEASAEDGPPPNREIDGDEMARANV